MKLIQKYDIIKGRITEKNGEIMASRTEAGSSSSLHPALSQGLSDGKVSQIEINGKIYLVFKVEGGQLADNPISPDVDLEKVKSVAKLVLDTHKAAAQSTPSLRDKEITHITDVGVRFGADGVQKHKDVELEDHKPYLTTTKDLDWQQGVINLEATLDDMDDDAEYEVSRLPTDFKSYLTDKGHTEERYTPGDLQEFLLDYTREKIWSTQHVDDQITSRDEKDSYHFLFEEESPKELIQASNDYIAESFTVQHVWQRFVNVLNGHEPPPYNPPEESDDDDNSSTTSSSSSTTSSTSSTEESDEEVRGRSRTPRRRDDNASSRSRSPSSADEPSFPSRSPSPSPIRSLSAPPGKRRAEDSDDLGSPRDGRSPSRGTSERDSRSRSRSPSRSRSRSSSPVPKAPPVGPSSDLKFEPGIHLVEMSRSDAASDRPRIDRHRTWEASSKGSVVSFPGSYQGKPSSIKGEAKRYLGPKESRLTRTYRGLLEAIQSPIGETERDYKGASAKLEAFIASPDTELQPFTDGELLAFRDEYNKAMKRRDFARHADKQDAVAFEALIRQLKHHQ